MGRELTFIWLSPIQDIFQNQEHSKDMDNGLQAKEENIKLILQSFLSLTTISGHFLAMLYEHKNVHLTL